MVERGERWSVVQLRLPAARLVELEERAAAEGLGFGDVLRDGVEALFADESEEVASDGEA